MRFGLGVFFASLVVTVGLAQGPKKPTLIASRVDQGVSYTPVEEAKLTVLIENRGTSAFYFYRQLEWGWTGLWYGVFDPNGNPVRSKHPVIAPLPPPPLSNKSDLVELEPGYFYGTHISLALSDYDLKPGTYFIVFKYRSYYHAGDGFGLPILTWDDGEMVADKIEISIRK